MNDNRLSIDEVESVVAAVGNFFKDLYDEPIPPFKTHDTAKLEGALAAPFQSAFQKDIYAGVHEKAAALFYFIAKDHAFENGNKRIAVVTLLYYLAKNNLALKVPAKELYHVAVELVKTRGDDKEMVIRGFAEFLTKHCVPFDEWA